MAGATTSGRGGEAARRWGRRSSDAIGRLSTRPRARWLTTFVLLALLGGLWTAATPLFSGPDEPSHVASAAALVRGHLTEKPRTRAARTIVSSEFGPLANRVEVVRLPASYDVTTSLNCFQARPDTPAGCLHVSHRNDTTFVPTSAANTPPLYYAAVGWVSLLTTGAAGATRLMRIIGVLLGAALLATAVDGFWRLGRRRLGGLGIGVAVTPMVLFLLGVVNPSSLEITAALASWACGLALVFGAEDVIDGWLVTEGSVAAIALALARPLGPAWLGLIVVTLAFVAPGAARRHLAAARAARRGLVAVLSAVALQLVWIIVYNPFDVAAQPLHLPASTIDRLVVGRGYTLFLQMIGVFGWLDTAPPSATWAFWIAAVGGLVTLAVAFARARVVVAMATIALLTVAVPMVAEAREAASTGLYWQGRYTLPLAVGVPLLAAAGLIRSDRMPRLGSGLFVAVGGLLAVAQVLAYAQSLRRYIVGRNGPIQFWTGSGWSPPLPALLLLVAFAVTTALFMAWLVGPAPVTADPGPEPMPSVGVSSSRDVDA